MGKHVLQLVGNKLYYVRSILHEKNHSKNHEQYAVVLRTS